MIRFLRYYLDLFAVNGPLDARGFMRLVLIAIAAFFCFVLAAVVVTTAALFVLKLGIGRLLDPFWLFLTMMAASVPLTLMAVGSFIGILGCAIIRFANTLLVGRWNWA